MSLISQRTRRRLWTELSKFYRQKSGSLKKERNQITYQNVCFCFIKKKQNFREETSQFHSNCRFPDFFVQPFQSERSAASVAYRKALYKRIKLIWMVGTQKAVVRILLFAATDWLWEPAALHAFSPPHKNTDVLTPPFDLTDCIRPTSHTIDKKCTYINSNQLGVAYN